jgi:O-antigen/teichoic acid export membrane protein
VFASAGSIFFRRYVLAPGLQLGLALLLVCGAGDVRLLAAGYLAAGVIGVAVAAAALVRVVREQGLLQHFRLRGLEMPVRAVFGFTLPQLSSDLVLALRTSLVVVLLEHFRGAVDVAAFRAVLPIAVLNLLGVESFTYLFTPLAARLYARDDRAGINDLYWQSAAWIAVITFPVFAVTFSLAQPVTVLLFGERYAQSALILAVLGLGHYFYAALGFNGLTLRVYGRVRYLFAVDLVAAALTLGANLVLIPRYGALGAAIGTSGALVAQTLLYHAGLAFDTGVRLFEWRWLRVYGSIALGALGLLAVTAAECLPVSLGAAVLVSLLVVGVNRKSLNVGQMFPELLRLPLARRLLA